ncbi:ChbG/HpnK family deacetylase [Chitinimonas sp.]|uniref:ChbG/HpnK family deacetylase n=1 Tax=Chitinimonas sp. TaxID=1934313 RepID=UPI0035AE2D09
MERPATAAGSKALILCADDFALNLPVSEAIVALMAAGRLSVTSCMSDAPAWSEHGSELRRHGWEARAGLHFNLTEAFEGLPAQALSKVMLAAHLRRLGRGRLRDAFARQLDRYEAVMGAAPAFVDGHQHVHLFPQVRHVLLGVMAERYQQRPWMRSLANMVGPMPASKALALKLMGANAHARAARKQGVPLIPAFAGLYSLSADADFGSLMQQWLAALPDGGLMMCHPATQALPDDVIGPARQAEFAWLASDAWPAALAAAQAHLVFAPSLGAV